MVYEVCQIDGGFKRFPEASLAITQRLKPRFYAIYLPVFIGSMKIFLSYSSKDRALAEPIYLALRAQGHKVFSTVRTCLPAKNTITG
jgi:hypothetical protein